MLKNKKMKAVIAERYGNPEVLQIKSVEKPTPKSNEVLVRINATSITAASTFMREGKPYFGRLFIGLTKPKVKTPGTDLSGIVEAVGAEVTNFKIGDQIMAETNLNCGAYAEYICLAEDELIVRKPEHVSAEEATGILDGACTTLAFFTDQVKIKKGQKVLINGASGSIGTAAIQIAKQFGAEVTGVCSGKNKALVKDLGAHHVLDYTKHELRDSLEIFDIIFDTVGKLSYAKTKKNLTSRGVFLTPVLSFSALLNMICVSPFTKKKLKFAATGIRNQEQRMRDLIQVRDMLAAKKLTTIIDRVYPMDQIQEAHSYVDSGRKRGNVILSINA
ncbi:MAG: NADPH:quinone reductase-like Zn-dependent oxidoreductase [Cyclobacteriaceae bacterium]|jgi:NADPH:quinone reductase-like Zn-dependent oxidoreductase